MLPVTVPSSATVTVTKPATGAGQHLEHLAGDPPGLLGRPPGVP